MRMTQPSTADDTNKQSILVVDDDLDIRTLLGQYLTDCSYTVHLAENGQQLFENLAQFNIDLIILDLMLPGDDGYVLCRKVRQQSNLPVIMLTAAGEAFERIVGLEIGADDYMSKPFNPRELLARIKAVLRRAAQDSPLPEPDTAETQPPEQPAQLVYEFSGWQLNIQQRRLLSAQQVEVMLTSGEFDLLLTFLERPNRVLSRDQLLNLTKQRDANPYDRSIDIQISRLRKRIEVDPKQPQLIKTIRGGGYMLTSPVKRLA